MDFINKNTLFKYLSSKNDETSTKRLKVSYIIALSLVALITIISQVLIRNALQNQESDGNVINISGRQRFLSQQISKNTALLLIEDSANKLKYLDELKKALNTWELHHIGLIEGNNDLKLPVNNSATILKLFRQLDKNFVLMLNAGKNIVSLKDNKDFTKLSKPHIQIILDNEKAFLKGMNLIVDRFAFEAKQKIEYLKWIELILMSITFLTLLSEGFFIFRPITKKINIYITDLKMTYEEVLSLSEELRQINEELFANNENLEQSKLLIESQKRDIELFNENVMDSINYAKRIQNAIMVEQSNIINNFKSAFILNIPKDIVSGDFYWFGKVRNLKIIILADCTGHGVGGAFMTMIGITLLNEIININETTNPKDILDNLDILLKATLQHHQKIRDGMDVAIVTIDEANKKLTFAGARQNLYYTKENQIVEIKGARNSIDGIISVNNPFANHTIDIEQGNIFYLTSDGYRDQFGGEEKRKYMSSSFRELLKDNHRLPLFAQRDKLEAEHYRWRGEVEQTDDVLIVGFQVF
ncbi:MAG: hypothetical protein EAZ06_07745 [Cytophagales bacterium]|nr:MAG: hypothetical protein EAZ06_07745 [Cytophagales bacterium]